jgi:tripartite-type tricarboxylate transporter receptor subunit TctC
MAVIALPLFIATAHAQDFPHRPVRIVVPVAAGGLRDVIARAMAVDFQKSTGEALVVDNRSGGGGLIAGEIVARAAPDGYTLFMSSGAEVSIAPALHPKLPYDPRTDFVPITRLIDTPMLLFAAAALPAQSIKELIALARAKPGSIVFGSAGPGSVSHLAQALFSQSAGVTFLHVPYRGAALALADMAGGRVSLLFTTVTSAKPLLDGARVRALGVAASKRTASLPNVPTFEELGLTGMDAPLWIGMVAPKGTPQHIIAKLHAEFSKALASKEVQDRLASQSAEIVASGPKEFGEMIKRDTERWATVVKTANIKIEQ